MYNPRFPHTLRVITSATDRNGDPVTDKKGNPVRSYLTLDVVDTLDGEPVRRPDGSFVTHEAESVNFGYRTATGSARQYGQVTVADYKIATPMFLNDLPTGTELELQDYERTFRGRLIKKTTYNIGTNLWLNDIKE